MQKLILTALATLALSTSVDAQTLNEEFSEQTGKNVPEILTYSGNLPNKATANFLRNAKLDRTRFKTDNDASAPYLQFEGTPQLELIAETPEGKVFRAENAQIIQRFHDMRMLVIPSNRALAIVPNIGGFTSEPCLSTGRVLDHSCGESSLALFRGSDLVCGAVRLSSNHVITAAHCVCDNIKTFDGTTLTKLSEDLSLRSKIDRTWNALGLSGDFRVFPQMQDAIGHCPATRPHDIERGDLAILALSNPVGFTGLKLGLMGTLEATAGTTYVDVWGYGLDENAQTGEKVGVKFVIADATAQTRYGSRAGVSEVRLEIGDKSSKVCPGDSGSGAFAKDAEGNQTLVGIISRAAGDGRCFVDGKATHIFDTVPRYFVRLDSPKVRSWIADVAGIETLAMSQAIPAAEVLSLNTEE